MRTVNLTVREFMVARAFLYDGALNRVVAERVRRTEDTVKTQMKSIFKKTGAADRSHLAVLFWSGQLELTSDTNPSMRAALTRQLGIESPAPT